MDDGSSGADDAMEREELLPVAARPSAICAPFSALSPVELLGAESPSPVVFFVGLLVTTVFADFAELKYRPPPGLDEKNEE